MKKPAKPSAVDRTVGMFPEPTPIDQRPIEAVDDDERGERVPMEEDVNRLRDQAFRVQEWTTKNFGIPEADGNEYRISRKGQHYYLEMLHKTPGTPTAYGYTGLMVHERDLYNMVACLVRAVRDKQASESEKK